TGDFRWELCKRIQGARWNDVSDHSLTSDYFDYVQFYRKNRDLSPEIKEKIKSSLQRAKNSFKEMFIRDYTLWVMYEGNGSPRLNKVARQIMYTYCPFDSVLAAKNKVNPIYTEIIERSDIKKAQRLHRLETLEKKVVASGQTVPETLKTEILYVKGKVSR
ncbi:MAG: cyclic nucleotide-binding domain-containing protein, partial [Clostridiales bacterium]|nr:cyclic nucleotide-binding domain-containing protein [Clostridiales bacterium]